jgi:hypothetical protein
MKACIADVMQSVENQKKEDHEKQVFNRDVYLNYQANLQRAAAEFAQLEGAAGRIQEVNTQHMGLMKDKAPAGAGGTRPLKPELLGYRSRWQDIPSDEVECLKKSAVYFRLAADNDRHLSDIEGLRMLEFGVRLLHRAGLKQDLDEQFKFFVKRGSDLRALYMKKSYETRSIEEAEKFKAETNKINSIIQDVTYLYKWEDMGGGEKKKEEKKA